jgi:ppGpp synthetase/RelA/SpoT-type nucleotidyltranferase
MSSLNQQSDELEAAYRHRYDMVLVRLADALSAHISNCMTEQPRIDRITARAKSIGRFINKARSLKDGKMKYSDPLGQIQDQIGARIVVFYKSDVERVNSHVKKYFTGIEYQRMLPESESEFGYFGYHSVMVLPTDIIEPDMDQALIPDFFELQIKTLFQHAWSEADHDLGYKPGDRPLTSDQNRLIAFTSAQAWGADHIFDQLFCERTADVGT